MDKIINYIFITLLIFSGFAEANNRPVALNLKGKSMNEISQKFQAMLNKTKLVCFGRFVIEVPTTAEVIFGPSEVPFSLERLAAKAGQIELVITNRLAQIEKERYRATGELRDKDSMLGKVIQGVLPKQKIVFGIRPGAGDYYRIESYVVLGEDIFIYKANPSGAKEDYEGAVQKLNFVSRLLSSRSSSDVPNAAGVCVDGGFVEESALLSHENITLGIRLAEFPDVQLSIATTKKDFFVESDALEARLKRAEQEANKSGGAAFYSRIKFIRQGVTSIDKWHGFEVLARKPAQANEKESHEFAFLSQGEPKNAYLPVLDIQLHSGIANNKIGQLKPSITDEEAILLWDKLTRSIRVRPVSAATSPSPQTQFGSGKLVFAGQPCPQSGWWECAHAGGTASVAGGSKQRFEMGRTMPQATLLSSDSLWSKLKNEQLRFVPETATVWTLLEADIPINKSVGANQADGLSDGT